MKKFIIFLLLFPLNSIFSQNILWTKGFSGSGENRIFKSILDSKNNLYQIGFFTGQILVNDIPITAYGTGGYDIFISKYNSEGTLIWFKRIGSSDKDDFADAITLSPDESKVFVSGGFFGNVCTFEEGKTINNTLTNGTPDSFLASIDALNGSVVEYLPIAYGSGGQRTQDMKFDLSGNLVIIGFSTGNTFTTYFLNSANSYVCNGAQNYFILQLNSNLELNWFKTFTGNDVNNKLFALDIDNNGYYIAGTNKNTLNLGIEELISTSGTQDMFLFKTDLNGVGQWVRKIKGSGEDVSVFATCDNQGHIYISGYYASNDLKVDSTASLPSTRTIPNKGGNDIFFAKYNTDGTLQWFDIAGSTGDDRVTRLSTYGDYIVIAGQYGGPMTFNNETLTPKGGIDALGIVHDKNDNLLYAISAGGTGADVAQSCVIDSEGNYIFTGNFYSGTMMFDTNPANNLTNATPTTRDVFIAKYKSRSISLVTTAPLCPGTATGTVTANPKGAWVGTKSYLWSKTGDPSFTATTQAIENVGAGTYSCRVTDDLHAETASIVLADPIPLAVAEKTASHLNATCYGATNGRLETEVTGGTGTITYMWSGSGTGIIAANAIQNTLSAGSYRVTVTDENGCTASVNNMVITQPQKIVFKNTAVTPINGSTGKVDLSVQGGTPAYAYSWTGPSGFTAATEDIEPLSTAGNYTVTITDQNSCNADTTVLIIDSNILYASITDKKEVSCLGGSDGSITITAHTQDLNPVFSYAWTGPDGYTANTATISGIKAGSYSVTVTDATPEPDKTFTITGIVVTQPSLALSVATTFGNPLCAGAGTGYIDANAEGGTLPYTYTWKKDGVDLTENTEVISELLQGNYEVTVTDAKGCFNSVTTELTSPAAITVTSAVVTPVSCIGTKNDGSIALTVSGGTGTLNYRWSNGLTTPTISLLSPGTYIATITDEKKCYITTTHVVGEPTPITAGFSNTNVSCFGGSNGAINLTPAGGNNGAYTFAWSTGAATEDVSGLAIGTYTVKITDSKNCEKSFSTSITEPTELSVSQTALQNATCNGSATGSISVAASGGTSPYLFSWSNSQIGSVASSLTAGSYTVTATDGKNCTKEATFVITEPSALQISEVVASHTDILCNGASTGTLEVTASGSSGVFEFSANGTTWQSSGLFSNLAAGNYAVMVRDQSVTSCTKTISPSIVIDQPVAITFSTPVVTNITCLGLTNGSINAAATGGVGSLTYKLKLNGVESSNVTGASNGLFTDLAAGTTYTVEAVDANNCSKESSQISVIEPQAIIFTSVTTTAVSCNGGSDGAINSQASGGTGAYTYKLLENDVTSPNITGASSGNFTGLAVGSAYKVEVTDANNCTPAVSAATAISQPSPISVSSITATDVTCNGSANGSIQVQATGGTGAYAYKLLENDIVTTNTTGATSGNFTGLAVGSAYKVEVTDANNCTPAVSAATAISQPSPISVTSISATDITCNGSSNGAVQVQATGGTGAYAYKLYDNDIASANITGATSGNFTGLAPGTAYKVEVTDANNCTPVISAITAISQPASVSVTSIAATDITCHGLVNGAIQIQAAGGTGTLSYKLLLANSPVSNTTGTTSGIFTDIAAGTGYTVEVTDANNCGPVVSSAVNILEPVQISISSELVTKTTAVGLSDGTITITAAGGTGALSYKLNNGTPQASGLFQGLPKGTYQVSVTDANNCGPVLSNSLIIDDPTSVSTIRNGTIKAYPNPATERVYIEVNDPDIRKLTVELKNISGKAAVIEKFEHVTIGFIAAIDLYKLPKGIYVIVVNNQVLKDKLIIQ